MNEEKDFFKTCFNTVAGLEVKNESQAIAKEVVLSEIERLEQENQQLKEQLLVAQTNEETFRLEMEEVTKTLGLDEDTIFDDVKAYVRSLKDNWTELRKQEINRFNKTQDVQFLYVLQDMQKLERGVSDVED